MGHTHEWTIRGELNATTFNKWADDMTLLITSSDVSLAGAHGEKDTSPAMLPYRIVFNGVEEDGHETFSIGVSDVGRAFCKTGGMMVRIKPYDEVVVAGLMRLKYYFKNEIKVRSDADTMEDIQPGYDLYKKVFKRKPALKSFLG